MALRRYNINNVKHIHRVITIIHMMLWVENIHHGKYIHLNIGTTPTALCIRIYIMTNELIGGGDDVNN